MNLKRWMITAMQKHAMSPLLDGLDNLERNVIERPGSLCGSENSPVRFNIPREALKMGGDQPGLPGFPRSLPQLIGSMKNIRRSVRDLDRNPVEGKKRIDAETLDELRDYAASVGADEIGYATVPQEWVFRDTAIRYNQAIVLVMRMDKERMDKAPNMDTAVMVHETYNALGQTANRIANWLRQNGYAAHAGHPLGGMALYPPMAQAAGLGWLGMSGLLITPRFGPCVRLAAVFTEIENLPVYQGNEHSWVTDYCKICHRCMRECPPQAFYGTPEYHDNGLVTVIDNRKCFPYFVEYHGCSICIKVCPFNQQGYEKVKENFLKLRS